jgi:DNA-binding PadR family transcriptional regulator
MHTPWSRDWSRDMRGRWGRGGPGQGPADPWSEMWNEWWRGPAPRAERGLVRYLILDAIATQSRHGYEVIQSIADKSGGAYKPSPGVVYPTLQLLEELGHARAVAQGERKTYAITEEGAKDLRDHAADVAEFYEGNAEGDWEHHADDIAHVMKRLGRIMRMFRHGMRRGGVRPSTLRKIRTVLDEALSKMEELLSPEDL